MRTVLVAAAGALLFSCNDSTDVKPVDKTSGLLSGSIDSVIKPGNDFFRYANGKWMDTAHFLTGLPYNGALIAINETIDHQLGDIIKEAASGNDYAPNSSEGQIKALYLGYLDTAGRNALGFTPVKKELDAIMAADSKSAISRLMGSSTLPSVMDDYVFLDSKNPKRYISYTGQCKLGLGSVEAYLKKEEPYNSYRTGYQAYIKKVFELAGFDNVDTRVADVMKLETKLAGSHWTIAETRNPVRMYHAMSPAELNDFAPGFDWDAFWKQKNREGQSEIVVRTDGAIQKTAKVFADASLDELKSFMVFRFLNGSAKFLTQDLARANFDFFEKTMAGVQEQKSLEKSAVEFVNMIASDQLGKIYSDKYYTPELKSQVEPLVQYMKDAVRKSLESNSWMDEPTRKEALRKFDSIHWKIGAPEKYHDYSSLSFKADDLMGNLRQLADWIAADNAAKLKEPKRSWEWLMAPQIANAYYQAEMNDIVLPVGILQPPVYDPKADPAALFGGLLAVVGHEISHGFDDKGSQSDADGILRNWWSDASRTEFKRRADSLVSQYGKFEPLPGLNLNGQLTLGENIGDIGGLSMAYKAYQRYVQDKQGGKAPVIDGLTGDQRFFLAWGQVWSFVTSDQIMRILVLTDYHSPNKYRVNGVVRNFDKWYDAFGAQPGDSLYLAPEQRINIY